MRAKTHPHHFDFSHQAVPQLAFRDGEMLRENLELDAHSVFGGLWQFVGDTLKANGIDPLDAGDLVVAKRKLLSGHDVWVVTMPEPEAVSESYFVGLVQVDDKSFRVFTLDKGDDPALVFRIHSEKDIAAHGFSGQPTVNIFLSAIQEIMAAEK